MRAFLPCVVCLMLASPAPAGDASNRASASAAAKSPKAVLLEYVAAWNSHSSAALGGLLDAQSVHEDVPAGFRGQGPEQIEAFADEVFKAQPDLKWRLTSIVVSGSRVAAEWTWSSTYTGEGPNGPVKAQKIVAHGAAFAMVEGGRIKRFVDYYDFASAFPAATEAK